MSTTDAEYVEMLTRLSNESCLPENKHTFIIDLVNSLHKNVRPDRRPAVKKFLMGALKEFSKSANKKVLRETFSLWLLLAEYSETMGLQKILDNVVHLYQDFLPFYRAYVYELVEKGRHSSVQEWLTKCQKACGLSDAEMSKEFPTLFVHEDLDLTSVLFNATVMQAQFHTIGGDQKLKFSEDVTIYHDEVMEDLEEDIKMVQPPFDLKEAPQVVKEEKEDSVLDPYLSQMFTLKSLSEKYKSKGENAGALIPSFFGFQLAECLAEKTKGGRIVRQLKPEAIGIFGTIDAESTTEEQLHKTIIKICQDSADDANKENDGRMVSGFLKSVGLLLFGMEFEVIDDEGVQMLVFPIPRACLDRDLWAKLYDELLNLSPNQKVDWTSIGDRIRSNFLELAADNKMTWQQSVEEFNGLQEY